jgi:hypothetical protein
MALLVIAPVRLVAHHSGAEFDRSMTVPLVGVISRINWVNPHTTLTLDVKTPDGKITTWTVEMAGPSALTKRSIDPKLLRVGDAVTIESWLALDQSKRASGQVLMTKDGQRLDVHDAWLDMILPR